jgi:hypothetical protein
MLFASVLRVDATDEPGELIDWAVYVLVGSSLRRECAKPNWYPQFGVNFNRWHEDGGERGGAGPQLRNRNSCKQTLFDDSTNLHAERMSN